MEMNQEMPNTRMGWHRGRYHWIRKIVFLVIVLVLLVSWCFGQQIWTAMTAKGYQAVFLTNGQVYFGKISANNSWVKLTDIYYLQVTQPLQQASTADQAKSATPSTTGTASSQPNIQLIKLGSELHGPTDAMYIERDKVLFWENMQDNSKVVAAIKQYKSK
jgi:hypothetical protein